MLYIFIIIKKIYIYTTTLLFIVLIFKEIYPLPINKLKSITGMLGRGYIFVLL